MIKKNTITTKKLFVFPVVVAGMLVLLMTRLIHLQIVEGYSYRETSEKNRVFHKRTVANRGVFLDRFKQPLVYNKPQYFSLSNPQLLYSDRAPITTDEAMNLRATSSASVLMEPYREYVYPESLSQVLGYVGKVSKEDLERSDYFHLQQVVGKTGLESVFERQLAGTDGEKQYEVNAKGELIREVAEKIPKSGENLTLSIDPKLSEKAYDLIKPYKGAIVIADPQTGEILSLVSTPTYNPNKFTVPTTGLAQQDAHKKELSGYFTHPDKLFFNRALAGGYPPGSVFKPVVALAGLDTKAFDRDTTVLDEGVLKVGEFEYGNWFYRQYGRTEGEVSLVKAIARSNDIYFYKVAELIGPERLATTARMFGFGSVTGVELPAEATGLVPDPAWKEKVIGEKWYLGNTYHFGIGQGDLLVTPLQVLQSISVFAHQGTMCAPTLFHTSQHSCKEFSFASEHLDSVVEGMVSACSAGGTAFPFFEWNSSKEYKVACKTGTAEFGAEDEKGHRKTHGWFTAFVDFSSIANAEGGKESYPRKVVLVVLVESDEANTFREGSKDAAPIAYELLKWIEDNRFPI